jgi:hypothetical protein
VWVVARRRRRLSSHPPTVAHRRCGASTQRRLDGRHGRHSLSAQLVRARRPKPQVKTLHDGIGTRCPASPAVVRGWDARRTTASVTPRLGTFPSFASCTPQAQVRRYVGAASWVLHAQRPLPLRYRPLRTTFRCRKPLRREFTPLRNPRRIALTEPTERTAGPHGALLRVAKLEIDTPRSLGADSYEPLTGLSPESAYEVHPCPRPFTPARPRGRLPPGLRSFRRCVLDHRRWRTRS